MVGARGEGFLELDGERYVILFTLRALADAERLTGKSVMTLMTAAQRGDLFIGDLASLVVVGLEAARREHRDRPRGYDANDAWRLLEGVGFTAVMVVVLEALVSIMSFTREAAPMEKPSDPPA